jgi:hypothetical protein
VIVDDEQRLVREPRLDRPHAAHLRVVVVRSVVVVDTDAAVAECAAFEHLEGVSLEDRRTGGSECAQVRLQRRAARRGELLSVDLERAEREVVDGDEVALVAAHRADQARAVVAPDLDVALARGEQRPGQVEQREDVLLGQVRDARDHVVEPRAPWVRRVREVLEQRRELGDEALDVHVLISTLAAASATASGRGRRR